MSQHSVIGKLDSYLKYYHNYQGDPIPKKENLLTSKSQIIQNIYQVDVILYFYLSNLMKDDIILPRNKNSNKSKDTSDNSPQSGK